VIASEVTILYRPVGAAEYALLVRHGFGQWPPRLSDQPMLHLSTLEEDAVSVAREWHAHDAASGFVGYVARFAVRSAFLADYPLRTVGARRHEEYWIPAERLAALNENLVGLIEIVGEYRA